MGKLGLSASRWGVLLSCLAFTTPVSGQTVAPGWMGGGQSPGFPAPLHLPTGGGFAQEQPQSQPQALPGVTPTTPQANPSTGQPSVGQSNQPGTPATPADPAATTTPETTFSKEVQAGIAAMSPGRFENTKYKWYGFVRLDGIFDFNPIASTDSFVTSAIPVPQGRGQNFVLTPRYTRLGFDTSTPWKDMDWTINTKIELDFFNGNTSGLFGSFPLRLRFAFIEFGPWKFGQSPSLFMDYDAYPDVLDYQGPSGMVLMRQPIAAYKCEFSDRLALTFGVEQPYSDIIWDDGTTGGFVTTPGTGIITDPALSRNVQEVPDLTGNLRYKSDYGHLQIAGIARRLTFQREQPVPESSYNELGYGVNVTGSLHPWALCSKCCMPENASERTPLQKSRFQWMYVKGRGINRYLNDVNGLGLDAVFEPVDGFDTLSTTGWMINYEHFWTDRVITNLCVSEVDTDLHDALPDGTYKKARYAAANIIWLPVERMGVGLEYLVGERENKNGETGIAHRLQAGVQYKF